MEMQLMKNVTDDIFKTILLEAIEGILIANAADRRFVFANKEICRMFGRAEAEFLELSVRDIHPANELERATAVFDAMARGESTLAENIPCLRADGSIFFADIKTRNMDLGGVSHNIGFFTDVTKRRQAETELHESREHLQLAIKGGELGTWDWDIRTGRVINNERWAEMIGYRLDELKETVENWDILTHFEDIPKVRAALRDHLEGLTPFYEIEHRMRHKAGVWIWVLDKGRVIERDADGKPTRMAGTHLDITDRKRMESELSESEHRYRMIAQMTSDYFFKVDADPGGNLSMSFVTEGLGKATGRTLDEVRTPDTWMSIIHPDDMPKAMELMQNIMTTGKPANLACRTLLKDGSQRWIWITVSLETEPETNRVVSIWGAVKDITENKKAEEALLESEAIREKWKVLQDAIENAKDAIVWADAETGIITQCNPAALALLERNAGEIIGAHHSIIHPPADKQRYTLMFRPGEPDRPPSGAEAEVISKSGKLIPVHISASFIRIGDRLIKQGIFRDLTDVKKAQAEKEALSRKLYQAQKMEAVGQLAGGMAHDFNNILSVILGTAQMTIKKSPPGSPMLDNLHKIVRSAHRAKELTTKLLVFARSEQMIVQNMPVQKLIRELAAALKGCIPEEIRIQIRIDETVPELAIDLNQVLRALLNLSLNAGDAMPEGGVIRIAVSQKRIEQNGLESHPALNAGLYCVIDISDDGPGIPPEVLDRLFEPFFTTKDYGKGTGLGLPVALGIIKAHKGHIDISNRPEGGALARVYLPATEAPSPEVWVSELITQPRRKRTYNLLIVDDDPHYLDMVCEEVASEGHSFVKAPDGAGAIELYRGNASEIDLVLLDIIMPGMDGVSVFEELKKINPLAKIILCSGYSNQGTVRSLIAAGAAGFIQKPFDAETLFNMFDRVAAGN